MALGVDLGFEVREGMAEKPFEKYGKGGGGGVVAANHNGRIADPNVARRLYALALERYRAGLSPTMANAVTCVHTAFWREWKKTAGHIQAGE